ncbi:hypothetical protein [Catenulispora sp. MAP5-51]|uniref:hypothetical protein n=1 Tax=Catenulispora sp. MAP5-51 TaxID=3156298 RepID=UPI003515CA28
MRKTISRAILDDGFLQQLADTNGVCLGPCGRRVRLRRWANMVITPIRVREQGGIGWRAFLFVSCLLGGYGALLWEEHSPKVTAILHTSRHAGLDLRIAPADDGPAWVITSFWAWPTGHGRGLDVITAVLAAADATGTTLLLDAANRWLAAEYYAPLGFAVRPGQEQAKRPWIERVPGAVHAEAASIARADVA